MLLNKGLSLMDERKIVGMGRKGLGSDFTGVMSSGPLLNNGLSLMGERRVVGMGRKGLGFDSTGAMSSRPWTAPFLSGKI